MCKTEWVLESSRQNHDAGLLAGLHGADGDNGVSAFVADGDAGIVDDAPRHRAIDFNIRHWRRATGAVLGRGSRSLWAASAADVVVDVVYQLQRAAGVLQQRHPIIGAEGTAGHCRRGAAIIARIIVRDNWSGDELARRLSVLSIAFIAALGGGQFIGGLLSQYSHWQMGFVLMGLTGLAILLLMQTLPLEAGRGRGLVRRWPRPIGAFCVGRDFFGRHASVD